MGHRAPYRIGRTGAKVQAARRGEASICVGSQDLRQAYHCHETLWVTWRWRAELPREPKRGQIDFRALSTSSAWPATFTPRHSRASLPSPSMRKVLRSIPRTWRPYMFFIFMTPKASHSFSSGSEMSSKGNPILALNPSCDLRLSRDTPAID